ncbi:hypothetical protein ABMA79_07770 [Halobacteriovorax sp. HFRX-2_2]|uniref:hypothetical protein n=1 Tax=unclassified Halobacteriovorax TaxID=2639665 RepID=UPI0037154EDE
MKLLNIILLLLAVSFTATARPRDGALYCGKHESHIKIYFKQDSKLYYYIDNTDLRNLKEYRCVEFTPELPFYDEVQSAYLKAQKDVEKYSSASTALYRLEHDTRYYCGNPQSGGLYAAYTKKYSEALYLYDIESKTFDTYDCINL